VVVVCDVFQKIVILVVIDTKLLTSGHLLCQFLSSSSNSFSLRFCNGTFAVGRAIHLKRIIVSTFSIQFLCTQWSETMRLKLSEIKLNKLKLLQYVVFNGTVIIATTMTIATPNCRY